MLKQVIMGLSVMSKNAIQKSTKYCKGNRVRGKGTKHIQQTVLYFVIQLICSVN